MSAFRMSERVKKPVKPAYGILGRSLKRTKPAFGGVRTSGKPSFPAFASLDGLFYDDSHMTDMVDEHDDPLPPATLTPTYYDRLAAEIMDDLDKVAAKFPKLEDRHRATANQRRAHLNVPRPFLGTAVVVSEEVPEARKLDPADGRETLQYLDAFAAVDDKLGVVRAELRFTMRSRRTSLAVQALRVYDYVRSMARDGTVPEQGLYAENLRRDLGKRGRPRKKRQSEPPPEPDRPDQPGSGTE